MASLRIKLLAVGLVIILIATATYIVVSPNGQTDGQDPDRGPSGDRYASPYAAQERGLFQQAGLNVELVPFGSAQERDTAFVAGAIDGYFGDMVNTLLLKASGQDVKVITVDYHHPRIPHVRAGGIT